MAPGEIHEMGMQHSLLHPALNSKVIIIRADGKVMGVLPTCFGVTFHSAYVRLNVNCHTVERSDSGKLCARVLTNSEDPPCVAFVRDHFLFCFLNNE